MQGRTPLRRRAFWYTLESAGGGRSLTKACPEPISGRGGKTKTNKKKTFAAFGSFSSSLFFYGGKQQHPQGGAQGDGSAPLLLLPSSSAVSVQTETRCIFFLLANCLSVFIMKGQVEASCFITGTLTLRGRDDGNFLSLFPESTRDNLKL